MKDRKEIIIKSNNSSSKSVELSKNFKANYLNISENRDLLEQPILTTNILFQIILDLKGNIHHTDDSYIYDPKDKKVNQIKMDLWETEFINSDKNEIKKVYKTSQFLKNYDKSAITNSLDFLKLYKNSIYTFENNKGNKITTSGGLIKDWYFSDKTGCFEITISLYWANKIVSLDKGKWNVLRHDIMRDFKSTKQRFFILWLMDVKKYSGTSKKISSFLETFDLNYRNSYEFMRGFLEPIKAKLDSKHLNDDWISFNYFLDENNNTNIKIVPYDVNPKDSNNLDQEQLKIINKSQQSSLEKAISYKVRYIKRRHGLSTENSNKLKDLYYEKDLQLFEEKYEKFKKFIRKEKKKVTDYKDENFVKKMEEIYTLKKS